MKEASGSSAFSQEPRAQLLFACCLCVVCGKFGSIMKLQGKVAVITGASMGIGEEIAKLFGQEGAKLVLCSRDLARTEAARQRIGAQDAISAACDVSRRDQVDALVRTAMEKYG